MNKHANNNNCPCGSGAPLESCCQPYISGSEPTPSPETLMRSRYTAYCLNNTDYLLSSWHSSTRPATMDTDIDTKWIKLKIIACENNMVEFIATCRIKGKAHKLHETSQFVFEDPYWFYVDGKLKES